MKNPRITPEHKILIKQMFLGPFLAEWRDANGKVDNSAPTIAKRLGYSVNKVHYHINKVVDTLELQRLKTPQKATT